MGFLMALFVVLRKKTPSHPLFGRKLPVSLPRNFKKLPSEFYPSNKKGVGGFNRPVVAAFLQLRNCWWLRDVGFFHGFLFNKLWTSMECCDVGCVSLCLPWSIKTRVAFAKSMVRPFVGRDPMIPWSPSHDDSGAIRHLQDRYVA